MVPTLTERPNLFKIRFRGWGSSWTVRCLLCGKVYRDFLSQHDVYEYLEAGHHMMLPEHNPFLKEVDYGRLASA